MSRLHISRCSPSTTPMSLLLNSKVSHVLFYYPIVCCSGPSFLNCLLFHQFCAQHRTSMPWWMPLVLLNHNVAWICKFPCLAQHFKQKNVIWMCFSLSQPSMSCDFHQTVWSAIGMCGLVITGWLISSGCRCLSRVRGRLWAGRKWWPLCCPPPLRSSPRSGPRKRSAGWRSS